MTNMKFGYARVSTDDQELARQIDALNNYGVDKIYKEKIETHDTLSDGIYFLMVIGVQILISTKDLLNLIEEWNSQGVKLVSLKESIDTTTPTGKLLTTVLSAISQFERDITVQRTNEGLQAARARGRKGGRPRASSAKVEKAVKLYHAQTHSIKEITAICGISQATLYRALAAQQEATASKASKTE